MNLYFSCKFRNCLDLFSTPVDMTPYLAKICNGSGQFQMENGSGQLQMETDTNN